jgi:hypothetical protein
LCHLHATLGWRCRYYNSEAELHRLFKSVNGLIFPGGLTDLWMDSPYVIAARKLWTWAKEANDAGGWGGVVVLSRGWGWLPWLGMRG